MMDEMGQLTDMSQEQSPNQTAVRCYSQVPRAEYILYAHDKCLGTVSVFRRLILPSWILYFGDET
jgi:hypothetical protein